MSQLRRPRDRRPTGDGCATGRSRPGSSARSLARSSARLRRRPQRHRGHDRPGGRRRLAGLGGLRRSSGRRRHRRPPLRRGRLAGGGPPPPTATRRPSSCPRGSPPVARAALDVEVLSDPDADLRRGGPPSPPASPTAACLLAATAAEVGDGSRATTSRRDRPAARGDHHGTGGDVSCRLLRPVDGPVVPLPVHGQRGPHLLAESGSAARPAAGRARAGRDARRRRGLSVGPSASPACASSGR